MCQHSGSNWNLAVLVFLERGKVDYPEKTFKSKERTNPHTCIHDAGAGNRSRAILVGGECSHYCTSPAPLKSLISKSVLSDFKAGVSDKMLEKEDNNSKDTKKDER